MKKSLLTFCGLMCALFLSAQTLSPKRGVSFNYTNEADLKAMSGTSWFYNWGPTPNNVGNIISSYHHEFCPMIWSGDGDANAIRNYVKSHPECKYLLWLNEPNFKEQAYMTPQQAAAKFPAAKALCQELGLKMISPACNYSAWAEYNTPAKWYDEFFKLVDKSNFAGLAIHSYMGWATATANYVEEYYQRYGLPIWLTEFCHWDDFTSNNGGTKEQQLKEMIDAVELLETNPHVARYAWFIPRRDGQAQPAFPYMELLSNANGVLTDLGKVWNNMSSYDNNYYHSTNSRIEAEHYISRASGMYMEETEDKSGEINFYGMSSGHQLAYNLNVASAGTYNIRFRVLTVSDAKIQVSTSAGSQTFALKNSNGKWESQDFTIPLTFGKQLMQVKLTSGGNVKFNYMELYSGNLPTDMGIVDPNQEIGEQVVVPQNVMGFAFDMENVPSNYANYNVDGIARKINIWQDEWSDKLTLTADGDGFLVNDLGWWGIGYNVAKKSSINMTAVDEDWRIHLDVKASASITSLELILGGYSGSEGKIQIADYVKVKDGNTYNTIDLPLSALTGMPNYSKIFADGNYFCLVGNGEKNAKIAWKNVYVYTTSQKQETAKPTYDGYIFVSNEAIPNNYQDYRTGNGRVLQIWKDEWSDKLTLVADGDGYRVNDLGWWGFGYNVTDGKMDMRNVDDTWKLSLEVRMDQTINTLQVILGGYGGATGEGKMNIQNMVSVKDGQTWNKIEIPLWMLSPDMPNYTREFTKVNYFCLSGDGSANSRIGWRNVKIYKDANSTIETSQYQGYAFTTPSVPAGYADYRVDDKSINLQIWGDEWSGVSTLKTIEASNNQMLFTIGNVGWWGAGYYVTYEKPMNMNNIKLADWTLHVEALMDSNVSEFKLNLAGAKNTEASISLADMCTSRNGEVYNVLDIPLTYFAGDLDYSKPLTEMNFMSFTGGGSEGARVGWKNVYLYKSGNSSDDNNDDDNTGNEGGNTGNEGGNTGNEGGNTGNEGGNTGNEGGNTQPVEGNLALNKAITSSTALTDMSPINNANDGKENTRWETKHEDVPSTVTIDLEQVYSLQEIAISWETACASDYTVEVSKDGNVWTNVANFSGLSGAHKDEIALNNAGRYVRINCQKRATQYGYSIWEVEVYGNAYTSGDNNEGGNTGNEGGNTGSEGGNTQPVEGNLALNKAITSSTALTDMSSINNANDGKENTRWETKHEDVPSTVTIDLEQVYSLQEIAISWETACASDYTVEVSKDGNVWTNVANFSGLSGAHKDEIALNNAGRYVRINCQKRATQYGYSIWEVEVYGNAYTSGDNNEGGNTGNEGGNTGNEGGNTQPVEGNLALNKAITSSTALTDMSSINNANDGKENTRWETKHEDVPSTVTIDLEQVYSLQEIAISWETACASDYTVEVSKDGNVWTNVANFSGLSGAHKDEIALNNAGRYVRINCQKRATQYGYSIWEVEVYGNAYTSGDNNEGGNTGNEGGNTQPIEGNLALNKAITSSSAASDISRASLANDGNNGSRWETKHVDGQVSLTVDLEQVYTLQEIAINWETACASDYTVEVSKDGNVWTNVANFSGLSGAHKDEIALNNAGRYVRVNCQKRATQYGYSIWEIEVYGATSSLRVMNIDNVEVETMENDVNTQVLVYPNPVVDELHIQTNSEAYRVVIVDMRGSIIYQSQNEDSVDMSSYANGVYFVTVYAKGQNPIVSKIVKK